MEGSNKNVKGIHYLSLALLAFLGLGIEVLYAFCIEPLIYKKQMSDWTGTQSIIHWIITCITWGLITYLLIRYAKAKYRFDIFAHKGKMKVWQWICVVLCIVLSLTLSYWDWDGFKVVKEFRYHGLLNFTFQYIYYIVETALFSLIIIFAQKAFELWFKKENIPYGGIILAATWGLAHIFTKGSLSVGLLSALGGFSFGIVYLLVNRDIRKTFLILLIMFIF